MTERRQTMFDDRARLVITHADMNAIQLRNYVKSQKELERRKSIRAVCPWCAYISTLDKFTGLNKDKTTRKILECPSCFVGMQVRTTTVFDRGPEAYSQWYWEQFYYNKEARSKLQYEKVKKVAKDLGFVNTFFKIQREIKSGRQNT